jgi:hypothetical protein
MRTGGGDPKLPRPILRPNAKLRLQTRNALGQPYSPRNLNSRGGPRRRARCKGCTGLAHSESTRPPGPPHLNWQMEARSGNVDPRVSGGELEAQDRCRFPPVKACHPVEGLCRWLIRRHLDFFSVKSFSLRGTRIFFAGVRKYHYPPVSLRPAGAQASYYE